ncbi:MAG: hypothetical protein ACTSXJ_04430 [Candidatus Baldrarchaeia archaeon]
MLGVEEEKEVKIRNLKHAFKAAVIHIISVVFIGLAFIGITEAFPHIFPPSSLSDMLFLYALVICAVLLPIQAALQAISLIRLEIPPFLLTYYFQYDPDEELPHQVLDPTFSKLGVAILLMLLGGGYLAWPVFAAYGAYVILLVFARRTIVNIEDMKMLAVRYIVKTFTPMLVAFFIFIMFVVIAFEWRARSR